MFISAIDMTIVNVALPEMSNELDAGIGELQWVLDAFLVSLAGLLLVGNGLADRFGRRRVFLLGLIGFAVTSVLAAAAQTAGELIAARALMGAAAACSGCCSSSPSMCATCRRVRRSPRASRSRRWASGSAAWRR